MPPGDVERAPSYDEVDDRTASPPSTVVTQKEEVTEQIFDQGESIGELTESPFTIHHPAFNIYPGRRVILCTVVPSVTKTTTITTTTELTTATTDDSNKQIIDEDDYEREEHKYSAEEKPSPQPPLVRQERRKSTSSSESYSEVGGQIVGGLHL